MLLAQPFSTFRLRKFVLMNTPSQDPTSLFLLIIQSTFTDLKIETLNVSAVVPNQIENTGMVEKIETNVVNIVVV
jgi:hypothetical protein